MYGCVCACVCQYESRRVPSPRLCSHGSSNTARPQPSTHRAWPHRCKACCHRPTAQTRASAGCARGHSQPPVPARMRRVVSATRCTVALLLQKHPPENKKERESDADTDTDTDTGTDKDADTDTDKDADMNDQASARANLAVLSRWWWRC